MCQLLTKNTYNTRQKVLTIKWLLTNSCQMSRFQMARLPDLRSHLKSRPFATQALFDNSKSIIVQISDPHCSLLFKWFHFSVPYLEVRYSDDVCKFLPSLQRVKFLPSLQREPPCDHSAPRLNLRSHLSGHELLESRSSWDCSPCS